MVSTTGQSVTLANSIIGVGILAMPFCFQQCGVLLATVILLSMGLVSRLTCHYLLKSAFIARKRNFEFLAFHVFGPAGKLAVEMGIIGFLMGTCIAYFVVVGDLGPQIIAKILNINQSDILRTSIMVLVSLLCVLPLGLLRNVDSLSNVSAATIAFYFCLVIKVITEAGSQLLTGEWHSKMSLWKPAGFLQCVPIFSMALFCQAQLFEIFQSLPLPSLEKMNLVTKNAINICTAVYFTLGLFGYIAFCNQNISGNILMSLSETLWSDVIKLGFVMSLAFSFPLVIFPCRASMYSLMYRKSHTSHHDHIINHSIPESTFRCITVGIIAASLFISLLIPNIELVLGLVGSTIGVMICIVFPAACFINLTFKNTNERILAKAVLILGLFVTVLGTYANLQAAESNRLNKYDSREISPERIDKIVEEFFESKKLEMVVDTKIKENPIIPAPPNNEQLMNKIQKDFEVQPPNPLPPDSLSNEKKPIVNGNKEGVKISNLNQFKDQPKKLSIDAQNTDQLLASNAINKQPENEKPDHTNEENNDMLKQKLIETIKQHGEEQKELLAEQKEILHEIKKTEEELKQKKDLDTKEAKLIAVESIQQIADVAIKKLSRVDSEKKEDLEQKANQAVEEIAKKAVDAIEAIKENNPKKDDAVILKESNSKLTKESAAKNIVISPPVLPVLQGNNNDNGASQQIFKPQNSNNLHLNNVISNQINQGIQLNSVNSEIPNPKMQGNVQNGANISLQKPIALEMSQGINIPSNDVQESAFKAQNVLKKPLDSLNEFPSVNKLVEQKSNIESIPKEHVHSSDEPQSYKQGKDLQKVAQNIINNIPIPIAINNQMQQDKVQDETVMKAENTGIKSTADLGNPDSKNVYQNVGQVEVQNRQKREAQDCENKNSIETLPSKVDFDEVVLPKSLLESSNVVHHLRSLKSIVESKKR